MTKRPQRLHELTLFPAPAPRYIDDSALDVGQSSRDPTVFELSLRRICRPRRTRDDFYEVERDLLAPFDHIVGSLRPRELGRDTASGVG